MQTNSLFLKACQNGQKGIVLSFLKRGGININRKDNAGFTPLHYACRKGTRDIARILIENDADVNVMSNRGVTPLHLAASIGSKEIMRLLIEAGADVDATDNSGQSVMIYAIRSGKTDAVRFLKEYGADASQVDDDGRSAIDYANITGMAQMMDGTIEEDVNKRDSYGNTPLHQSCYNGHSEMVKRMLQNENIEVDAMNDIGETPLHIAIREDNLHIAELLLAAGADSSKIYNDGEAPIHIAAKHGKAHIVGTLLKYGSDVNSKNKAE